MSAEEQIRLFRKECKKLRNRQQSFVVPYICGRGRCVRNHIQSGRDCKSKQSECVPVYLHVITVHAGLQRQARRY